MRARATPSRKLPALGRPGRPTASFHSERPAMKPSAPPSIDVAQLVAERLVVDAGREHRPRHVDRVGHAPAPARAARVLELEDLRAALLQEDRAVDDEVLLAGGELLRALVVEPVGHQLHHAEQVGARGSPRAPPAPCRRCSRRGPRGRRAGTPSPSPRWRPAPARPRRRGPGSARTGAARPRPRGRRPRCGRAGPRHARARRGRRCRGATRRGRAAWRWRRARPCRRDRP